MHANARVVMAAEEAGLWMEKKQWGWGEGSAGWDFLRVSCLRSFCPSLRRPALLLA